MARPKPGQARIIVDIGAKPAKHANKTKRPMTPLQKANAIKNLKPYKPGAEWTGLSTGRPKGSGQGKISIAYNAVLTQKVPDSFKRIMGLEIEEDVTWADVIAFRMTLQACNPGTAIVDMKATEELRQVTEGPLPTRLEQTGRDGRPLPGAVPLPPVQINFRSPEGKPKKE